MRIVSLILIALAALASIACAGGAPEPSPTPAPALAPTEAPDIAATVEAGIAATREMDASIRATVEAQVAQTLAAPTEAPMPQPTPTPTPTPTRMPTPTQTVIPTSTLAITPTITPAPTLVLVGTITPALQQQAPATLQEYSAHYAGGPGAIYVGDLGQLAGPAPTRDQGDFDGNVPLESLERHLWIYESSLYQKLIDKAKLTDPTPMTYDGEPIIIQHVCINRVLLPCKLLETFFAPNLFERTGGKLEFTTTSLVELGVAGHEALGFVKGGTLDSATIYAGYAAGEIPAIDIMDLWGIYSSHEQAFVAAQVVMGDIEELVLEGTGGAILNRNWYSGNDQFLFCKERIDTPEDLRDRRIRAGSTPLSDWTQGMGARARFVSFTEVYGALERGLLDCGITRPDAAYGQRWQEVTNFLIGPLIGTAFNNNVISAEKWAEVPDDLQQIILEEAAKSELEALRLASIQNEMGMTRLTTERGVGTDKMELVPFSYEIKSLGLDAAAERVIPAWVSRVGHASHPIIIDSFNGKIGPIVGLMARARGPAIRVPITQGPYAGKTVEQILAE